MGRSRKFPSPPLTKQQQHINCCVACAVTNGITEDMPPSIATSSLGRKVRTIGPILDTVTKNLRNPYLTDDMWKRIKRAHGLVAKSLAYSPDWEAERQEEIWAGQVFLSAVQWRDCLICCPIWFGHPKEIAFGVRIIDKILDETEDELVKKYGADDGPAVVGTDVYLEISDLIRRKL